MPKPILVCGDSMWDEYIWGDVERISPEAPVPVIKVQKTDTKHGAAGNVVANIVALGGTTHLVTHTGCRKLRIIARGQHVCRVDFDEHDPIAAQRLDELEVHFQDRLQDCETVVFSDYAKGTLQRIKPWIHAAKNAGCVVLVDPKGIDYSLYQGADLLKPNTPELQAVIGGWRDEAHLWEKVRNLLSEHNIHRLLLTRSERGATLMDHGEKVDFPSSSLEVRDVTGAGDTVIATLAFCLNQDISLTKAVHYAIKAAGITCRHLGTYAPTASEVFSDSH